jgi:hypothetical protein
MTSPLDHFIWACNDLERASRRFEALTGVRPRYGGVHASGLTHNALVGLGGRCYLEILAPTANSRPEDDDGWSRFARAAHEPRLFTYCLRSSLPLAALALRAESLGCGNTVVGANARTTPAGTKLRWQWLGPTLERFSRAFPFFIDWLDTPHPAESFAAAVPDAGIRLVRFAVGHPDAAELSEVLMELGARIETYAAPDPQFQVQLDTPLGAVAL